MKKEVTSQMVQRLHETGKSNREISRLLKISRNSVRILLQEGAALEKMAVTKEQDQELVALIKPLLHSCRGNLVRVHEVLAEEHNYTLAYSTLTYLVRKYHLQQPPPQRVGEYVFEPGLEMQHDTSPHWLLLGDKRVKAQCASLVLGFSRMVYMQYYPCFTRFEAKTFLMEALSFMQGCCRRCIIDNTSVILTAGAGSHAVPAPEMIFFSRIFGFEFIAHAVNHCDRKGKIERPFHYIENNFLAGRTFSDWCDLNRQARLWCEQVANHKPKRELGMAPETAYIQEKPSLLLLPEIMPPIYNHCQRVADIKGFINFDTNCYSIPEKHIGHTMDVYQYINKIEIYYQHQLITQHPRIIGQRYKRSVIKGHHVSFNRNEKHTMLSEAERQLSGHVAILDAYILTMKSKVRGRGCWAFNQLLQLKRLYPTDAFMAAIEQAQRYGLYDMKRLEAIILKQISKDFFNL